jgi:hypothetical protein
MVGATRVLVSADAAGAQERIGDRPWISGVRLVGFLGGGQRPGWAHSWHAYADRAPLTRRCLARHPAHPGITGGRVVELRAALLCFGSSHAFTVARRASALCEAGPPLRTVVAVAQEAASSDRPRPRSAIGLGTGLASVGGARQRQRACSRGAHAASWPSSWARWSQSVVRRRVGRRARPCAGIARAPGAGWRSGRSRPLRWSAR